MSTEGWSTCVEELMQTSFMKVPSKQVLDNIVVDFLECTNNKALQLVVCACCAREVNTSEASMYSLLAIPNQYLLKPQEAHVQHDLYNGILLEPAGVDLKTKEATICDECYNRLKTGKLPPLALANDM